MTVSVRRNSDVAGMDKSCQSQHTGKLAGAGGDSFPAGSGKSAQMEQGTALGTSWNTAGLPGYTGECAKSCAECADDIAGYHDTGRPNS